jgi:hypothetical protein
MQVILHYRSLNLIPKYHSAEFRLTYKKIFFKLHFPKASPYKSASFSMMWRIDAVGAVFAAEIF